jgi:hypothetical protein
MESPNVGNQCQPLEGDLLEILLKFYWRFCRHIAEDYTQTTSLLTLKLYLPRLSGLDTIPAEIWEHLFQFLPDREDQNAVNLTCKLWYSLTFHNILTERHMAVNAIRTRTKELFIDVNKIVADAIKDSILAKYSID